MASSPPERGSRASHAGMAGAKGSDLAVTAIAGAAARRSEARPQTTWIDAFDQEGPGDVRSATAVRAWAAFGLAAVRPPG